MSSAQCLPVKRWREVVREGVGDEEDGGGDSGGKATGTQKRGSKQGEALASACFTLERERGERDGQIPDGKSRTNRKTNSKKGRRAQETATCEVPQRQDIRQMQLQSTARGWQQSVGIHTHKAAGRGQTATTRRHHCPAQAASHSPRVRPVTRLPPKM